MRGVDMKRVYLIEREVGEAPAWLKPFLRFSFMLRAWRRYCFCKVSRMSEGDVLKKYYSFTGGQND